MALLLPGLRALTLAIFHLNLIHPLVHRELGGVYEALEEYDKAREAYEYFVEYWNEADPELQPMVEEARQAITRLQNQ